MKHTKPFTVMTGLGRAYVVNVKHNTVLVSYPLQAATDDSPREGECESGLDSAHELCEILNRKENV